MLEIETIDITLSEEIAALRSRLKDRRIDLLFVNAGVKNDDRETIVDVSTEEFVLLMVTHSPSPMRVLEAFQDLVKPTGTRGGSREATPISENEYYYQCYREAAAYNKPEENRLLTDGEPDGFLRPNTWR
jgi:NAD(P)-dependent dehydrogenase (short-subunit alcohol dehydrogenase family)